MVIEIFLQNNGLTLQVFFRVVLSKHLSFNTIGLSSVGFVIRTTTNFNITI